MIEALKNVVVVGGSYVGANTAKELATLLPATHRVVLVEPHSHFHHLFAFPRFAIVPKFEHKAFIPYTGIFSSAPDPARHVVVKARVASLQPKQVILDREWQGSKEIPFDYLVVATGTRLTPPGSMESDEKAPSIDYFKQYQQAVKQANSIAVVGGGAVGVQMSCDLKEVYPEKEVTLIHSRDQLMPVYNVGLSNLIKDRFKALDVHLVTGSRVIIPEGGFPNNDKPFEIELKDGRKVPTEFAIVATGQTPNNDLLKGLQPSAEGSLVNPANGFIPVKPTMQFKDPQYPQLFAVGDIADSGAHKAARPGAAQAAAAAKNIVSLIEGREPSEEIVVGPPGIHLTLGLTRNVLFRNPNVKEGETEPFVKDKDDGHEDMGIDGVWVRRGVQVNSPQEYHL